MIKRLCLLLLILVIVLAACGTDELPTTPTPFGFGDADVVVLVAAQATAVPLVDLVAEPELYDGQFIQLSGQYKRLPLLVCNGEAHPAPATWTLVTLADIEGDDESAEREEIVVAVDGLDSELRALLAEGTLLTVDGYWRFWEGAVGCGKQAVPSQMWYLKATELVSPGLLAQVTAVFSGSESGDDAEVSPTAVLTPTISITQTPTTAVITATLSPTPEPPVVETPFVEPTAVPTIEEDKIETETPTVTPESQPTGTPLPGTTGTPTGTPSTGSTATPTVMTTPNPTGQPGSYVVVTVDAISPDDVNGMFGFDTLVPWQKQNWPLTLSDSTTITIGVAAEPTMDVVIAVYDDSDTLLVTQNNAVAGQLEEIRNLSVDPAGTYFVQVYDANGTPGHYFMTIVGSQSEVVLYSQGILTYGATRQATIAEEHSHFWYFYGQAGDVVDIVTSAQGDALMLLSLYNQSAVLIKDENGSSLQYEEEEILDVTLPETGLYLIRVEEEFYSPASYSITLIKN